MVDGDIVDSAGRPEEGDTGVGAGGGVPVDGVERVTSDRGLSEIDCDVDAWALSASGDLGLPELLAGSAAR